MATVQISVREDASLMMAVERYCRSRLQARIGAVGYA